MNALTLENVTKHYSGFTLENVSFAVPKGSIVGFIGENGAGKSTTLRMILDLVRCDSGSITVLGEAQPAAGELRERIGVVMEDCGFPDNLTPKQINVMMQHCYKTWNAQTFADYLQKFALPAQKMVKEYSRGMQMKLSIAVALSHASELLILDEATSGLDPIVREEILDVFLEFIQDEEHSILISSHILSDLEKICDYIAFIHNGKLLFCEEKDVLLHRYAMVRCSAQEFAHIAKDAVIGVRKNSFGVEALVERNRISNTLPKEPVTIEELMLYFVKETSV